MTSAGLSRSGTLLERKLAPKSCDILLPSSLNSLGSLISNSVNSRCVDGFSIAISAQDRSTAKITSFGMHLFPLKGQHECISSLHFKLPSYLGFNEISQ